MTGGVAMHGMALKREHRFVLLLADCAVRDARPRSSRLSSKKPTSISMSRMLRLTGLKSSQKYCFTRSIGFRRRKCMVFNPQRVPSFV